MSYTFYFQDCDEQLDNYERKTKEEVVMKEDRASGAAALPKSLTNFHQRAIITLDSAQMTT